MTGIARAGSLLILLLASSVLAQNSGAPAPIKDKLSSQQDTPLAQAKKEVAAARKKLDDDTTELESAQDSSKSVCETSSASSCDKSQAAVHDDLERLKADQAALDQAWKKESALQHAAFQSALQKKQQAEQAAVAQTKGGAGGGGGGRHRRGGGGAAASGGQSTPTVSRPSTGLGH